jgi:iron complex outermembrane recepter protein
MGRSLGILIGAAAVITAVSVPALSEELQEVVVTAQKRSENLQNVPIGVSAVSADQLAASGITSMQDIASAVSGVNITRSAAATQIYIRGVGTTGGSVGQENAVSTYVDGVYMPGQASSTFAFNNVERLEVLKGPQGTLFGRNATGGVINIITRAPSYRPELDAEVGYGNLNTLQGTLYATSGFGQRVAADLAVFYTDQRHGFGRNIFTGADANLHQDHGARTKLRLDLSDATLLTFAADYTESRGDVPFRSYARNSTQILSGRVGWPFGFWDYESDFNPTFKVKNWGGSAHLEQDLGWGQMTNITAYRALGVDQYFDVDLSQLPLFGAHLNQHEWQFSEELNLASPSGSKVQWIGGLYYLQGPQQYDPWHIYGQLFAALTPGFTDEAVYSRQYTRSYAAYAQTTFNVVPDTDLTLGARYTIDKRTLSATGGITLPDTSEVPIPGLPRVDSTTFKKPTWRIALEHHFTPDYMVYGSYSRGFHSGIYNTSGNVVTFPAVQPETLDAFELGTKNTFAHRLRLNLAAFYYDYKNLQLTTIDNATEVVLNAAGARMYGVDLDADASLTDHLSLRGGATFLRGYYTSFPAAPITSVNTSFPFGDVVSVGSAKGHWLNKAPEYTFNVALDYDVSLGQGTVDATLNYAYTGKFYWEPDNRLVQGAYGLLNGQVKWTAPGKRYYFRLFVANLLNKGYFNEGTTGATGDIGEPAPGRTYGMAVGLSIR